jgi:hypothetical protein
MTFERKTIYFRSSIIRAYEHRRMKQRIDICYDTRYTQSSEQRFAFGEHVVGRRSDILLEHTNVDSPKRRNGIVNKSAPALSVRTLDRPVVVFVAIGYSMAFTAQMSEKKCSVYRQQLTKNNHIDIKISFHN